MSTILFSLKRITKMRRMSQYWENVQQTENDQDKMSVPYGENDNGEENGYIRR